MQKTLLALVASLACLLGAARPAHATNYMAAAVASDLDHDIKEAAHCTCLTLLGLSAWCGGWVPLAGAWDPEILDYSKIYVWGQAITTQTQSVANAYRTCALLGGFEVDSGGQTVDDVYDEGYDPLTPVATLRVAAAACYSTGQCLGTAPDRTVFY